jgi:ribosomal protein S18 acetylase RimI-like enzyme
MPNELQIRKAGPADADAVRRLVREAYAQWVPLIGREPMPMRADYEKAVREHEIDLVHSAGELVALIELIVLPDQLYIENIAVPPEHQRKGLGRFLLRHAERRAAESGLPRLGLLTNQAFESNVRLYLSTGFRIDRTEPFSGGGVTVHMSKERAAGDT